MKCNSIYVNACKRFPIHPLQAAKATFPKTSEFRVEVAIQTKEKKYIAWVRMNTHLLVCSKKVYCTQNSQSHVHFTKLR